MSSSRTATTAANLRTLRVVEILDNTHGMRCRTVTVERSRYDAMLAEPEKVDCPLLERWGYPLILVSTTPGQKVIPVYQLLVPVSNNPHNNHMAGTFAVRADTGLAMGCVVGNVYALRVDGKSFTADEFWVLWDHLYRVIDSYALDSPPVTSEMIRSWGKDVRHEMQSKGLIGARGTGERIVPLTP